MSCFPSCSCDLGSGDARICLQALPGAAVERAFPHGACKLGECSEISAIFSSVVSLVDFCFFYNILPVCPTAPSTRRQRCRLARWAKSDQASNHSLAPRPWHQGREHATIQSKLLTRSCSLADFSTKNLTISGAMIAWTWLVLIGSTTMSANKHSPDCRPGRSIPTHMCPELNQK